MIKDLREYLALLEEENWLDHVVEETELLKVPTIMKAQEKKEQTVIFEKIVDSRDGTHYAYRLVNNLFANRDRVAKLFGCRREDVSKVFAERYESYIDPVMVENGPCHEVVEQGDDIDILKFPFIQHNATDAGRFITAGMAVVKDPETGVRNLSFHRMELKGKNKTGFRMTPYQDMEAYYKKACERGQNLQVAVCIGNNPLDMLAAACGPARDIDELRIAGSLRQEPVQLVKCLTVDLEVPSGTELVLEGYIAPEEREAEGPFGDFMEFSIPVMENPVFHITCVTHRKNPIVQAIGAGSKDDGTLLGTPREAQIYKALKAINIDVSAISLNVVNNYLTGCVAIRKHIEDEPTNAILAAFGSFRFLKNFIVVDHDVDVYDPQDIFWAMSTRLRAERGVMVIPHAVGFGRDVHGIHSAKLGIDATAPLNCWDEFARVQPPSF